MLIICTPSTGSTQKTDSSVSVSLRLSIKLNKKQKLKSLTAFADITWLATWSSAWRFLGDICCSMITWTGSRLLESWPPCQVGVCKKNRLSDLNSYLWLWFSSDFSNYFCTFLYVEAIIQLANWFKLSNKKLLLLNLGNLCKYQPWNKSLMDKICLADFIIRVPNKKKPLFMPWHIIFHNNLSDFSFIPL